MNRLTTIGMIVALLFAGISTIPVMSVAQETPTPADESDAAVSPGQLLSGILGVQDAELDGELDRRVFGIRVAQAASNDSKADIVKENLAEQEARLAQLQAQKQALDRARENGSIDNGSYNAQVAVLAAQTANVQNQLQASENVSDGLPAELLASKGINVDAIQMLKNNASNMTGPEVAAIAKTIAGPDIGRNIASDNAPGPIGPDGIGPPGDGTPTPRGTDTNGQPTSSPGSPGGSPDGTSGNQPSGQQN